MRAFLVCRVVAVMLFGAAAMAHGYQDERKLPEGITLVKLPPGKLPEGVIHLKLPPGGFSIEDVERDGKIVLRITAGETVIETKSFFIGDGNGAAIFEAPDKRLRNIQRNGVGSSLYFANFVSVDKLKPGSFYVTTPSVFVGWVKKTPPPK